MTRHRIARRLALGAATATLLVFGRPGVAQPRRARKEPTVCENTYQHALKLQASGDLAGAKHKLSSCAAATQCSLFMQHQCTRRYDQIEADESSVVATITDRSGAPVVDARLSVDGGAVASKLDGHAVAVEPGLHVFSFEIGGQIVAKRNVVIVQGQRNRPLSIALGLGANTSTAEATAPERHHEESTTAPEAEDEQPRARPAGSRSHLAPPRVALVPPPRDAPPSSMRSSGGSPFSSYLLIGTGLAGLGGYGILTYWGRKDNTLLKECTPSCPSASVDHIKALYLGADVSLGVGAAALLGGSWLAWRHRSHYSVEIEPARTGSGAVASLGGKF